MLVVPFSFAFYTVTLLPDFWLAILCCKDDQMRSSFNVLFIHKTHKRETYVNQIIFNYSAIQPLMFYIIPFVTFSHSHSCLRKRLSWFETHLAINVCSDWLKSLVSLQWFSVSTVIYSRHIPKPQRIQCSDAVINQTHMYLCFSPSSCHFHDAIGLLFSLKS